jgi:hypothetical protein
MENAKFPKQRYHLDRFHERTWMKRFNGEFRQPIEVCPLSFKLEANPSSLTDRLPQTLEEDKARDSVSHSMSREEAQL